MTRRSESFSLVLYSSKEQLKDKNTLPSSRVCRDAVDLEIVTAGDSLGGMVVSFQYFFVCTAAVWRRV